MIESFAKIRRLMRIGQIAERTGLSAKALRLYEARGLLTPDGHSERGYRLFGETALMVWTGAPGDRREVRGESPQR